MLLIGAGRAAQRLFETRLAEHGLTLRHIGALGHLAHTDGLTYSDLARRARVTPQSMHATMTQLAERGAITVELRGRAAYPTLTERGHRLLGIAADIAADVDESFALTAEDQVRLRAVVERAARSGGLGPWADGA